MDHGSVLDTGEPVGQAHIPVGNARQEPARERLRLVNEAGLWLGDGRLDVRETAQRLAESLVSRLCDHAHVELFGFVVGTGEPDPDAVASALPLLRAATATAGRSATRTISDVGEVDSFASLPGGPVPRALASRRPVLLTGEELASAATDGGNTRGAAAAREHVRSWLAVPMRAGELPLGVVVLVRFADAREQPLTDPYKTARRFDSDAVATAAELVQRAGIAIDHARLSARERARALDLQRLMLPGLLPGASTVDVAYRHLPAPDSGGLGGAWYDIIRLSGARTALVVGDVPGEGLDAAVYVPRFRTATRALAYEDLSPEEVLTRLDAMAKRFVAEFVHRARPGRRPVDVERSRAAAGQGDRGIRGT